MHHFDSPCYELPSPKQLFNVAAIGMTLGRERGIQKPSTDPRSKGHNFVPKEVSVIHHEGYEHQQIVQRYLGKVARRSSRSWGMRIDEKCVWIGADKDVGTKYSYSFEWDKERATLARRSLHIIGFDEEPESVLLESIPDEIFEPDYLVAVNQFEEVTSYDCDNLLRNLRKFQQQTRISALLDSI